MLRNRRGPDTPALPEERRDDMAGGARENGQDNGMAALAPKGCFAKALPAQYIGDSCRRGPDQGRQDNNGMGALDALPAHSFFVFFRETNIALCSSFISI